MPSGGAGRRARKLKSARGAYSTPTAKAGTRFDKVPDEGCRREARIRFQGWVHFGSGRVQSWAGLAHRSVIAML